MKKSVAQDILESNLVILKQGPAMKKQSRLHNYAPVILVLTSSSIMYFHDGSNPKPASTIPLSAVISACIVTEPSISIYHGVSQNCSFVVSIGDRSFKFRVDAAVTATSWAAMIMSAKENQINDAGEDNPLVITNTAGDNSDGTKFWRTKPVGYVENFNAAIDSISSVLPAVVIGNKSLKERDGTGLSRRQIEALLTFETFICLTEVIAQRTATAFFDMLTVRPRSRSRHQERIVTEDCNNISRLLGHSIAHWLVGIRTSPPTGSSTHTTTPRGISCRKSPSSKFPTTSSSSSFPSLDSIPLVSTSHPPSLTTPPSTESERMRLQGQKGPIPHTRDQGLKPSKTLILHYWIESCVLHEFHRFSSRAVTDEGTLSRRLNMPFRSGSNTGLFIACLVRSLANKSNLLYKWLNPALSMISNVSEPCSVIKYDNKNTTIQFSRENIHQNGRIRSNSDDTDLGIFFKDVVACHKSRENFDSNSQHENSYYSDDEYEEEDNLDLIALGDIQDNRDGDEVRFLKKLKPGGTFFMEDRPALLNMRSHVFVMAENEIDDTIFGFIKDINSSNNDIDNSDCNSTISRGIRRTQSARSIITKEIENMKEECKNTDMKNNYVIQNNIDSRIGTTRLGVSNVNKRLLRRSFDDTLISKNRSQMKEIVSSSSSSIWDRDRDRDKDEDKDRDKDGDRNNKERRVKSSLDIEEVNKKFGRKICLCIKFCTCTPILKNDNSRFDKREENYQREKQVKEIQPIRERDGDENKDRDRDNNISKEDLLISNNPIEREVEMERIICTLIIERMSRYRDEIPIALEILFKSLHDVCSSRDLSGLDSKATGYNIYYSCCSALLVTQLISPALIQPIEWNLACPSLLYKKKILISSQSSLSHSEDFEESNQLYINEKYLFNSQNSVADSDIKELVISTHTIESSVPITHCYRNVTQGISPLNREIGHENEKENENENRHENENRYANENGNGDGNENRNRNGNGGFGIDMSDLSHQHSFNGQRTYTKSDAVYEAIKLSNINSNPISSRFSKMLIGKNNSENSTFSRTGSTSRSSENTTPMSTRNGSYEFSGTKYGVYSPSNRSSAEFPIDLLQLLDPKMFRKDSIVSGVSTGSDLGVFHDLESSVPLTAAVSSNSYRTDSSIYSEDGSDSSKSKCNNRGGGGGGSNCKSGITEEEEKGKERGKGKDSESIKSPKKIVLSETLMHAAISLISIAHMLGGEGKTVEALLFVWGVDKVQGNKIFNAARTLINCVPLKKAFELSESIKKLVAEKAENNQNMCGASISGFNSVEECRALNGLSRAMCRAADQAYMMTRTNSDSVVDSNSETVNMHMKEIEKGHIGSGYISSSSSVQSGISDERTKSLLEPLRMFYEDVGGCDILYTDD